MIARPFSLPVLLMLAACAGSGRDFPSLQQREVERQPILVPDLEPAETVSQDVGLTADLAPIVREAEAAHTGFLAQQKAAEAAATRAGGARQGSEAWVAAQQALSVLEAQRGATQDVVAKLDAMLHDPANAGGPRLTAILAAIDRVQTIAAEEEAAIAALSARLA